jgi:hypothetical protein
MEKLRMTAGRRDDESAQTIVDCVVDQVSEAAERIADAGHTIVDWIQDRVDQLTSLLHREEPTQVGQPAPVDIRPMRPKRHASTWSARRDNQWVPVHRVKDVGWVWSE